MLYIIIGGLFGAFLCYTFVTEYLEMRKTTNQFIENGKDYQKNDHSLAMRLLSLGGAALGVFSAVVGISIKDDLNIALGIALTLMFIGQYFSLIYRSMYFYNESSVISAGKLIRFKSVRSITTSKSVFMKSFSINTFNGENIIVSKKTALFIAEKTGKSIGR